MRRENESKWNGGKVRLPTLPWLWVLFTKKRPHFCSSFLDPSKIGLLSKPPSRDHSHSSHCAVFSPSNTLCFIINLATIIQQNYQWLLQQGTQESNLWNSTSKTCSHPLRVEPLTSSIFTALRSPVVASFSLPLPRLWFTEKRAR